MICNVKPLLVTSCAMYLSTSLLTPVEASDDKYPFHFLSLPFKCLKTSTSSESQYGITTFFGLLCFLLLLQIFKGVGNTTGLAVKLV
ncbi:hypothetical protein HUJ04_012369 [Dendroctonus ponderosae]|nr:hypothetical protein HUJ04_012369 [Dendroctonus ponderosae]